MKIVQQCYTLLFGSATSSLVETTPYPVMLPLPEGMYYGDITRFTCKAGRPRSPLVTTMRTGSVVTLHDGIPMGNGQGALVSISSPETNIQAALCDVLRCIDGERAGWFPREVAA